MAKKAFDIGPGSKSLLFWTYAIGCFDLIAALLFTVVGLRTINQRLSWLVIFAIFFGIFWISMILMLILGIHGRKHRYVRAWIIFSCASILAEIFLFLYGILGESCYQKGLVRNGLLLVMGLFVEFIFLYIVHRFYVTLAYCEACHQHPKNKKGGASSRKSSSGCPSFPTNGSLLQNFNKH